MAAEAEVVETLHINTDPIGLAELFFRDMSPPDVLDAIEVEPWERDGNPGFSAVALAARARRLGRGLGRDRIDRIADLLYVALVHASGEGYPGRDELERLRAPLPYPDFPFPLWLDGVSDISLLSWHFERLYQEIAKEVPELTREALWGVAALWKLGQHLLIQRHVHEAVRKSERLEPDDRTPALEQLRSFYADEAALSSFRREASLAYLVEAAEALGIGETQHLARTAIRSHAAEAAFARHKLDDNVRLYAIRLAEPFLAQGLTPHAAAKHIVEQVREYASTKGGRILKRNAQSAFETIRRWIGDERLRRALSRKARPRGRR